MHNNQHRIPHISDPDKLRTHFNSLNGKDGVRKPWTASKLKLLKRTPPEEARKREAEHADNTFATRRERERAVQLLEEIEVREQLMQANADASEEAIRARMAERAAERRRTREERLAKVEEAAELDREYKRLMCTALREVVAMLKESAAREDALIAALTTSEDGPSPQHWLKKTKGHQATNAV